MKRDGYALRITLLVVQKIFIGTLIACYRLFELILTVEEITYIQFQTGEAPSVALAGEDPSRLSCRHESLAVSPLQNQGLQGRAQSASDLFIASDRSKEAQRLLMVFHRQLVLTQCIMSVSFGTQAQGLTLGISKTFCDHHGGLSNSERPVSIGFD
jgi:hypothetical protein